MIPASEMFLAVLESKPRASGDDPVAIRIEMHPNG